MSELHIYGICGRGGQHQIIGQNLRTVYCVPTGRQMSSKFPHCRMLWSQMFLFHEKPQSFFVAEFVSSQHYFAVMERVISFAVVFIIIFIIKIIFRIWGLSWNRNKIAWSEMFNNNVIPTVMIYDMYCYSEYFINKTEVLWLLWRTTFDSQFH